MLNIFGKNNLIRLAASLSLALGVTSVSAADSYPNAPIELIVNYGAGGNTDVASRYLANGMETELEESVVVLNRPGAMGTMGPAHLSRQKNDGQTIGVVTYSTIAIAPHLMDVPYTIDDFDYIAGFGRFRYGVAVRSDAPYDDIDGLIKAAKESDGLFFGAPSAPNNLAMFDLARITDTNLEQILYKSGAETVNALLSGQVDIIVQNPSDILPHVQSGKMKLIASASPIRWPELPDVPTIKEQGYPVEIDSWLGIAAPEGTSPEKLEILQAAALAAMQTPEVQEKMQSIGIDPVALTGAEYKEALAEGYEIMGKAIKEAGLPRVN